MSIVKPTLCCAVAGIGLLLASGCASKPENKLPLTYVAVTRPAGVMSEVTVKPRSFLIAPDSAPRTE